MTKWWKLDRARSEADVIVSWHCGSKAKILHCVRAVKLLGFYGIRVGRRVTPMSVTRQNVKKKVENICLDIMESLQLFEYVSISS